jgi:XisI protein
VISLFTLQKLGGKTKLTPLGFREIPGDGWDESRRIHGPVVSLEIIDGKVCLQADNTYLRIAERLEEAGIAKSDIVLGFQPLCVRPYTEYAVA